MKGTLTAGAILGVLAIGGLPALAQTMAADAPTAADAAASWQPGDGAPPWSNGHHGTKADKADKAAEEKAPKDAAEKTRRSGELPPGLARKGKAHHGAAMRVYAHCLAAAEKPADDASPGAGDASPRSGDDEAAWKKACAPKPTPPGHAKHPRR